LSIDYVLNYDKKSFHPGGDTASPIGRRKKWLTNAVAGYLRSPTDVSKF
jgi:hypothetical protein